MFLDDFTIMNGSIYVFVYFQFNLSIKTLSLSSRNKNQKLTDSFEPTKARSYKCEYVELYSFEIN